jgi:hypothetical protein
LFVCSLPPPAARDGFLRSVAFMLADSELPGDAAVIPAVQFVLSERGAAVGKSFFGDGQRQRNARALAKGAARA